MANFEQQKFITLRWCPILQLCKNQFNNLKAALFSTSYYMTLSTPFLCVCYTIRHAVFTVTQKRSLTIHLLIIQSLCSKYIQTAKWVIPCVITWSNNGSGLIGVTLRVPLHVLSCSSLPITDTLIELLKWSQIDWHNHAYTRFIIVTVQSF